MKTYVGTRQSILAVIVLFLTCTGGARGAEPPKTESDLKEFFKENKVQVKTIGPLVVLDGEVETAAELVRIDTIVAGLREAVPPVAVRSLVKVSAQAMTHLADVIERNIGSAQIATRFVGNRLLIEGIAESDFEADRALAIAESFLTDFNVARGSLAGKREPTAAAGPVLGDVPHSVVLVDMMRVKPRSPKGGKK